VLLQRLISSIGLGNDFVRLDDAELIDGPHDTLRGVLEAVAWPTAL